MDWLPFLLGTAVLLPLVSFAMIFVGGPRMGPHGKFAGVLATLMIVSSFVLSCIAMILWIGNHWPAGDHGNHAETQIAAAADRDPDHQESGHPVAERQDTDAEHTDAEHTDAEHTDAEHTDAEHTDAEHTDAEHAEATHGDTGHDSHADHAATPVPHITGKWYTLGTFGKLSLEISYYIDALTICMFCMVTLIASCIHFYATGYMHDELHDPFVDHEVTTMDGNHLHRPGRYHRFFQFLSLFCFSMLGLVVAGNIAMTFVFWELVGICSYFLIGFYVERHSASTAANKAFIVNRIGDFGMIIGLMALWASLGTFSFGDIDGQSGLFSLVRPAENNYALIVPDGMVRLGAQEEVAQLVAAAGPKASQEQLESMVAAAVPGWRNPETSGKKAGHGYWLLVVAGIGIFCGCVGKSAQFPLHVWLPDAMEGPTPVSALVHSATMVAAGVFLVARFYPVFAPEVLFVISLTGAITLFVAATIAITATDIKRVLAYSTVSQLGYMMLALGLGGWLAGVMHLFTHAFFKSLLFMCSGSVIHGVHTNEMTQMGGLRKKMPYTAYTMLVGCLAIAGAGIPFIIGFSGYYSKDAILEHAYHYKTLNPLWGSIFFFTAAGGAAITAFYMFRLWYMTFAGEPRDQHRYDHAHESPPVMYVPLIILAVFAIAVAWPIPGPNLHNLLEQARPTGTAAVATGALAGITIPDEHVTHAADNFNAFVVPATLIAFSTALGGFLLATVFYGWQLLDPAEAKRSFAPIYKFLWNKWWFDELYDWVFVKPTLLLGSLIAAFDRKCIDRVVDGTAHTTLAAAVGWEKLADQWVVDGSVNKAADWTYSLGLALRKIQTGRLRQYVMFIAVGTTAIFVAASFFWKIMIAP